MDNTSVLLNIDKVSGIATITLNRPQALNALNRDMVTGFDEATANVAGNDAVRAVVIEGAGQHFMAGGDIKFFHSTLSDQDFRRREILEEIIGKVHESVIRIHSMEKPVLASVHGAVAGFGLSLMSACDLAIAASDSYFTLAYCHIGTSPDGGGTYNLPRQVGLKQAMEIALLGDRFDAETALRIGLINRIVAVDELQTATTDLAKRLAQGPTLALGRTKRLLNESLNRNLSDQLFAEQESFLACAMSKDFAQGVSAFIEKRKPHFEGN
jgi:2-(1,2-epoxy-1,2-dihydrophenyl)acetyl-CoA isomerase